VGWPTQSPCPNRGGPASNTPPCTYLGALCVSRVYTWGSGGQGQLGHGVFVNATRPKLVASLEKVRPPLARAVLPSPSNVCPPLPI
jgi:hypothetical protein